MYLSRVLKERMCQVLKIKIGQHLLLDIFIFFEFYVKAISIKRLNIS